MEMTLHVILSVAVFAMLAAASGMAILSIFKVDLDGYNNYLKMSLAMVVSELSVIFLANILLRYVGYQTAALALLLLFLFLAALWARSVLSPMGWRSVSYEGLFGLLIIVIIASPAIVGAILSEGGHADEHYRFVSLIRNGGLPIVDHSKEGGVAVINYHYGIYLILSLFSALYSTLDCIPYFTIYKGLCIFHIVAFSILLFGVISQMLPDKTRASRLGILLFILYFGGNLIVSLIYFHDLPFMAYIDMGLIPKESLVVGKVNPLTRSMLSDPLLVAFRILDRSATHLLVLFLPVLFMIVVTRSADVFGRVGTVRSQLLPATFFALLLSTTALISEDVFLFVSFAMALYCLIKFSSVVPLRNLAQVFGGLCALVALFVAFQGGTISHVLMKKLTAQKHVSLSPSKVVGKPVPNMEGVAPQKSVRVSLDPALIGYAVGRMSLIFDPVKVLVYHGLDYYLLIPVLLFYLLKVMDKRIGGFNDVLDLWMLYTVPMVFFSLFLRVNREFLTERFNRIEISALACVMLYYYLKGKIYSESGDKSFLKKRAFALFAAVFFLTSTSKGVFYYVSTMQYENEETAKYCANHIDKLVKEYNGAKE